MNKFDNLFVSIKSNFEPQPRSLEDLGIILEKAYFVLKETKFDFSQGFWVKHGIHQSDILRLIQISKKFSREQIVSVVENEAIERIISEIKTIEIHFRSNQFENIMYNQEYLLASILMLIESIRQVFINDQRAQIYRSIKGMSLKDSIIFLSTFSKRLKQNEEFQDLIIYAKLQEFLDLEIEILKLKNDLRAEEKLETANDLFSFVQDIIKSKLQHEISYHEGYRNFWRDEAGTNTPKKENEIQQYIKSILKPYCEQHKVKIHRESTVANGYIDMTFTYLDHNVCVEIKKAQHSDVETAVNTQLTRYMDAEKSKHGIYLILWYKNQNGFEEPKSYNSMEKLIKEIEIDREDLKIELMPIDCTKPISPSNIK